VKASITETTTPRTRGSQSYRAGKRIARPGRSDDAREDDVARWETRCAVLNARKYAPVQIVFAISPKIGNPDGKLLETYFFYFSYKPRMGRRDGELLELL